MRTRRLLILGLSATIGVFGGWIGTMLISAPPLPTVGLSQTWPIENSVVSAQTFCGQAIACGGDPTVTSVIDVDHRVTPGGLSDDPVQINSSETVTITAYWSLENLLIMPAQCRCSDEINAAVNVAMSLSGSTWTATCTGCNVGGPIVAVTVCDINADDCASYDGDYRLIVDVNQLNGVAAAPCNSFTRHINRVSYVISSISSGNAYDTATCTLGTSVSPTQSTFSATDTGAFECAYNCSQTGASVTVIFQ